MEYRGIINGQPVFLITKAGGSGGAVPVIEEFLFRKDISFERWLDTDKIRKQMAKQNPSFGLTPIQNLRHGMKKVNLKAEVVATPKPQLINTQFGNRVILTDVWIADETGKIKLCLWGELARICL